MTLKDLQLAYNHIGEQLDKLWPIADKDHRIFARTMKVIEELGELSDEILSSMNLQRADKIEKHTRQHLEDEFADTVGSLLLLARDLNIDLEAVLKRKIEFTTQRLKSEIGEK